MKILKAIPGARRLMESLRSMGYDPHSAIADLVDNSVAARASEVHIDIRSKEPGKPAMIVIADNGDGMNREDLHEAMRFGAVQEYSTTDLGKYGLGLKTASLSQSRVLTVVSKAKSSKDSRSRRTCMRWDVDHVYGTDDWELLVPSEDELSAWEKQALGSEVAERNGTVVLWSSLDEALPLLSSDDPRERERFLAKLIEEVSSHLSMVFHRFLQGSVTGRRKLTIYVCGEPLSPWDPFCRDESTKELDILELPVVSVEPDGSKLKQKVTVSPFILPREDEFSSPAAHKTASGPKNWNQHQGLYFYRNNRLLQAGGWSYLRAADEHTKLLRVAIDFPGELDKAFALNITKMRARIPAEIRDTLASYVSAWAKQARTRYDRRAPAKNKKTARSAPTPTVSLGPVNFSKAERSGGKLDVTKNGAAGLTIRVPSGHDLAEIFSSNKATPKQLCLSLLGILEAVYERKLPLDRIPMSVLKRFYKKL